MSEIKLADRPSIKNIARHMFKQYDSNNKVYCVSCNRVLADTTRQLKLHFDGCRRKPYIPSEKTTFTCGPCKVTTVSFNDRGKYSHVDTQGHRDKCKPHRGKLFSNTCRFCKTMIFDTEILINKHIRDEHMYNECEFELPFLSMFMGLVYSMHTTLRPVNNKGTDMHYCGACRQTGTEELPDHSDGICVLDKKKTSETFYCASCRVTFVCKETAYWWHLSSVEHVTLLVKWEARTSKDDGDWNVSRMIWRHFSPKTKDRKVNCNACRSSVRAYDRSVVKHFEACTGRSRIAAARQSPSTTVATDYKTYCCIECSVTAVDVDSWTKHVLSGLHRTMMRCGKMRDYTHYECLDCSTLHFGSNDGQIDECHIGGATCQPLRLVTVAELMRYVYEFVSTTDTAGKSVTFFYRQSTGAFGRCDRNAYPASVPFFCSTCRLEFYGDRTSYRQHAVTVEHLLLRQFGLIEDRLINQSPTEEPLTVSSTCVDNSDPIENNGVSNEDAIDEAYGRYVAVRLKAVRDRSLKTNIKFAIDTLLKLD